MYPQYQQEILPVYLQIEVAGTLQTVTILEDLGDVEAYKYKIRFENGQEDVFTLVEGPELYVRASGPGYEDHERALVDDLYNLTLIEPGMFFYVLAMNVEGEEKNVWLIESEPEPGERECLNIRYDGKFQFELYYADEDEGWSFRGINGRITLPQQALAEELTKVMESIRKALQISLK
jgi:hypothetical protein